MNNLTIAPSCNADHSLVMIDDTELDRLCCLFCAASAYSPEVVRALIADGADVNRLSQAGETPLFSAAFENIPVLVKAGVDINVRDCFGQTAFFELVKRGKLDAAEMLIAYKADPNISDNDGVTPLQYVVSKEFYGDDDIRISLLTLLLENGANPNSLDRYGQTSLHHIVSDYSNRYRSNHACMRLLAQYGADICIVDKEGKSALHRYCEKAFLDTPSLITLLACAYKGGRARECLQTRDQEGNMAVEYLMEEDQKELCDPCQRMPSQEVAEEIKYLGMQEKKIKSLHAYLGKREREMR